MKSCEITLSKTPQKNMLISMQLHSSVSCTRTWLVYLQYFYNVNYVLYFDVNEDASMVQISQLIVQSVGKSCHSIVGKAVIVS